VRHDDDGDRLDRRAFLESTTAAGLTGLAACALGGCAAAARRTGQEMPLDPDELQARLRQLDAALERIGRGRLIAELIVEREGPGALDDPDVAAHVARADGLARKACGSFLAAGLLLDLPEPAREHPDVRARLGRQSALLAEATAECHLLLTTCPEDELREIDALLAREPEIVTQLCESMDRRAGRGGVGTCYRRRLGASGNHLVRRLRQRPLAEVVDDCVAAGERLLGEHGVDVAALVAASACVSPYWLPAGVEHGTAVAKSPEEGTAPEAAPPPVPEPAPEAATPAPPPTAQVESAEQPVPYVVQDGETTHVVTDRARAEALASTPAPPEPGRQPDPHQNAPIDDDQAGHQEYCASCDQMNDVDARSGHSPGGGDRRYRVGRQLTIAGAVTFFLVCGLGFFLIIPGIAMLCTSATYRARQAARQRARRERRRVRRERRRGSR
jgi:hypothetical protein